MVEQGIKDARPVQFELRWVDGQREPRCQPNPAYPNGIDVCALTPGEAGCKILLPYPARRIGTYFVECKLCFARVGITTAGRADDPRSLVVPCRLTRPSAPDFTDAPDAP